MMFASNISLKASVNLFMWIVFDGNKLLMK